MISFWEKSQLLQTEVVVVGGGITGLSAACSLKEMNPALEVMLLERGVLPTGASTKNAGFACIGSLTEKLYDISLMGEDALVNLVADRWSGLQLLRKRLGDQRIDYQNLGGFELLNKNQMVHPDQLESMNKLLFPVFQKPVFSFCNELIPRFGFRQVDQMICNEVEGQINTGLMMKHLWKYAAFLGVRILTGASVMGFTEDHTGLKIELEQFPEPIQAQKLIVCTNAFTKQLLPQVELLPGRGQVLMTNSIPNLPWKGVFNFDEGFYYFRNLGDRIIFGGGRNLDFVGETTTALELNQAIQKELERHLKETIIPGRPFEITDRWSGIMAFGKQKLPLVEQITPRVWVGARLNGMGVALGSTIGEKLANLVMAS